MTLPDPGEKKEFVHHKFSAVSEKYDLLNSLLSCYVDHYWRWIAARELSAYPDERILDLCAGTLVRRVALRAKRKFSEKKP